MKTQFTDLIKDLIAVEDPNTDPIAVEDPGVE